MSDGNLVGAVLYLQGSATIIHLYQDEEWLEAEINFAGESYDAWMDFSDSYLLNGPDEKEQTRVWVERWRSRTELIGASLYIERWLADRLDD